MAKYTKPDMTYVWASGGSKTAPSSVKIQTGWIVEKPEFEKMNWVQNRQDDSLAYIFQMGVPEWDSAVEYQYSATYKSYVQRNGVVYKALQVGTNKDPASEAAYWTIAFDDKGAAAAVQSNLATHITNYGTLASLSNATTARTNLDVYSKGEGDARYAGLAGNSGQEFAVAAATGGNNAVNKSQLDTKAGLAGNAAQEFAVAAATGVDNAVNKAQFDSGLAIAAPVGGVLAFAGTSVPNGWLECNGGQVSRTTYSALFSVLGTLYGIGDGSTTFNLPELRGEFIRGYDNARGVDVSRSLGSWQDDSFESHTHSAATMSGALGNLGAGGGSDTLPTTSTTTSSGGSETRPRNVAMYYIIKV